MRGSTATSTVARRVRSDWQAASLPLLLGAVAGLAVLSCTVDVMWAPPSLLVLPVLAGGLLLSTRRDIVVVSLAALAGMLVVLGVRGATDVRPATFVLLAAVAAVSYLLVGSRERLGVSGL